MCIRDRSYSVHAHKGTIGALEQAVNALGLNITIREWFQTVPMLKPYTFEVFIDVNQIGVTELQYQKLIDIVNKNKNLRSHWKFANTFVISEASAEIVNLPICCGHDFEYAQVAGSDIFNIWSDWSVDNSVVVNQGVAHYTASKSNNDTTLESYADLNLTEAIVCSLHDSDMQQWQAVKDACNELTGNKTYSFDSANNRIVYQGELVLENYEYIWKYSSNNLKAFTVEEACTKYLASINNPPLTRIELLDANYAYCYNAWGYVTVSRIKNTAYNPNLQIPSLYLSLIHI